MSIPQLTTREVTIAINQSLSSAVDLEGAVIDGVLMPAAWTAATISFEGSMDNVTFHEIGDGTSEVSLVAAGGWIIVIPPGKLHGAGRYLKVRSGTSTVPVNQTTARTLTLLSRF